MHSFVFVVVKVLFARRHQFLYSGSEKMDSSALCCMRGLVWFGLVWFGLDWIAANVVIFGWLVNSLLEKRNERDFVNTD